MNKFRGAQNFPKRHFSITPDDDTDLVLGPCIIYVKTDGNVECHDCFGNVQTYALLAGDFVPVMVKRVLEDTTATVIGLAD